MKLDFCISHNYTQRNLFLPPSTTTAATVTNACGIHLPEKDEFE
jgi:hypothetical protein